MCENEDIVLLTWGQGGEIDKLVSPSFLRYVILYLSIFAN